jgi:hypothetical protein
MIMACWRHAMRPFHELQLAKEWWVMKVSNLRPADYKSGCALKPVCDLPQTEATETSALAGAENGAAA